MDYLNQLFYRSKEYHVFISHAWKYDSDYLTVLGWLKNSDLKISDYSVPQHDPLDANNTTKLKRMLTGQIAPANIVIVIAGMYAAHSEWIEYEINEAVRMGKAIIAIAPWGQEHIPHIIRDNCIELIRWQSASLINTIVKY